VAGWVRDGFGFEMRIALMPVSEVRAHGHDVRVARFAASPDVTYAMFSGGGMVYAERRMKEGAFAIPPAETGIRRACPAASTRSGPNAASSCR
jgi:hypothetical protein